MPVPVICLRLVRYLSGIIAALLYSHASKPTESAYGAFGLTASTTAQSWSPSSAETTRA